MKHTWYIFLLLMSSGLTAQVQNTNWVVSSSIKLKFENQNLMYECGNTALEGYNDSDCVSTRVSYSNDNGDLIYYVGGLNIYDGQNNLVSKDYNLRLQSIASQVIAISPLEKQHYLFTISPHREDQSGNIFMQGIDISDYDNITITDLGNSNLEGDFTYLASVIKDCESNYLITYDNESEQLMSILVNSEGVGPPIPSDMALPRDPTLLFTDLGGIFLSQDLSSLLFSHGLNEAILCDFDIATGSIRKRQRIQSVNPRGKLISACFSSNSKYLYTLESDAQSQASYIYQYDLFADSIFSILINPTSTIDRLSREDLQLANDGKIYLFNPTNQQLHQGVIEDSNESGLNSNFTNTVLDECSEMPLNRGCIINTPNVIYGSFFDNLEQMIDSIICSGDSIEFGNQILTIGGLYIDTLTTSGGCDSIVHLDLMVIPSIYRDSIYISLAQEASIEIAGLEYNSPGQYELILRSASGCDSIINIEITSEDTQVPTSDISISNIFSPNNDGIHDEWAISLPLESNDRIDGLWIYDRWGTAVYQITNTTDSRATWDGQDQTSKSGANVGNGVYLYAVRLQDPNGRSRWISGDVTVLR